MPQTIPVTVLIPAYNARDFLQTAIETVRSQTVSVEEIVVVDDGSVDDTALLAERLGVRLLRERRGGPAAARNAGLAAAKSEWIAALDADDIWHPRKLELQYNAALAEPRLGLIFTDFDTVSMSDGRIHKQSVVAGYRSFKNLRRTQLTPEASLLDADAFLREIVVRSIVLTSTTLFRRELAVSIGGFSANVKAEDTEFFLRLASRTLTGFVDRPLVAYMRHPSQVTARWELDPVRLELYHYVVANNAQYHPLVVEGFRRQYATALYYSAANAADKRRIASSCSLMAKALAVAVSRGQLTELSEAIGQSQKLRSRILRIPSSAMSTDIPSGDATISDDLGIPWRQRWSRYAEGPAKALR